MVLNIVFNSIIIIITIQRHRREKDFCGELLDKREEQKRLEVGYDLV
jgi:hypothetical protein